MSHIHERTSETSGEPGVPYVSEGFAEDGGAGMTTAIQAAGDPANAAEGRYDRLGEIKNQDPGSELLVTNGDENFHSADD
jgi:hypothetical protein